MWTVLASALWTSAASAAEQQHHPLRPHAAVLQGLRARAELALPLPPPEARTGPVTIELHWTASQALDRRRSTLTLRWNDRPLRTVPLEQLTRDGTGVPLSAHLPLDADASGQLVVQTHLVLADDDPCPVSPDQAWLTVDPVTEVRWTTESPPSPVVRTVGDWLTRGQERSTRVEVSPAHTLVGIEMDHTLRHRGALVRPVDADRAWQLDIGPLPGAPEQATAHVSVDANHILHLWAVDEDTAATVARALRGPLAERCAASGCWIPPQVPPTTMTTAPRSDRVVSVVEAGHATGWVARGAGLHALRLVWVPPPGTLPGPGSRLELDVNHAPSALLDAERSSLEARLNGRPLGTWTVDQQGRWSVPVPEELWGAAAWVVDLEARLRPHEDDRCRWTAGDELWLTLGTSSGLYVPPTEPPAGLAAFAAEDMPSLSWDHPPTPLERWTLAAAAFPLFRGHPWRWRDPSECTGRCLMLTGSGEQGLHLRGGRWVDGRGDLAQPMVHAQGAVLQLAAFGASLTVASEDTTVPAWERLTGPVALGTSAGWTPLGVPPPPPLRTSADASPTLVRPPDGAARRKVADLLFGLGFLGTLAACGLWLWTGARQHGPLEEL